MPIRMTHKEALTIVICVLVMIVGLEAMACFKLFRHGDGMTAGLVVSSWMRDLLREAIVTLRG